MSLQGKTETRVGFFVLMALVIFAYMGFQIGSFRFDWSQYASYSVHCSDVNGLSKQADVKIAGVKVGWVEDIVLTTDDGLRATVTVMLLKKYTLYENAYAIVRQQSILGNKYLEIIPGDPGYTILKSGNPLIKPTAEAPSIDEILKQFNAIAHNVQEVTDAFKDAVGTADGKGQMKQMFEHLRTTADRLASFSVTLQESFERNKDHVDTFLRLGTDVRNLAEKLDNDILPAFKGSIDRISDVFDRDFNRIATKLESTASSLEQVSTEAKTGVSSACSVVEKINDGKGTLGGFINDDQPYNDLKFAAHGLRNYFSKVDRLQIIFDSHVESMHRPAENYEHTDGKGYFTARLYPNEDHFYQVQLVSSEKGYKTRHDVHKQYSDNQGDVVKTDCLTGLTDRDKLRFIYNERLDIYRRNSLLLGLQFGKVFKDVALRFGLFEGSAGVGLDIDIPLRSDSFRWVTSFEAFDFSGWNRKDDRRPHLKWLNKMYLLRSLYLTFGADDFASKRNANMFFGVGLRFGDDDVKLLLSGMSGVASCAGKSAIGVKTGNSTVVF